MAKDSDSPEIRFPLRRSAVPAEPPLTPAPPKRAAKPKPEPVAWRPPPAEPEHQWFEQQFEPEPLELTRPMPPQHRAFTTGQYFPPPPPPLQPQYIPEALPEGSYTTNLPVAYRKFRWGRWVVRGAAAFIVFFVVAVGWLALTAPLSKSLLPPAPPSITLLDKDGVPIAKRGAEIDKAVVASQLPAHVREAFIAIDSDERLMRIVSLELYRLVEATNRREPLPRF